MGRREFGEGLGVDGWDMGDGGGVGYWKRCEVIGKGLGMGISCGTEGRDRLGGLGGR
jgi:hypothetical protein